MSEWLRGPAGKGPETTPHAALLPRYQHLRQVALELNNRLVSTLPKSALDKGGKDLGILRKNVLTLDTEDVLAVLMDHCIYDVLRNGTNAIEQYLAKSPPPEGSDEMVILRGMREARYAVFVVEATAPGVGVEVRDLLRDEVRFLWDVGLSQSASIGTLFASRIMAPEGIGMTTGAALPVGVLPAAARKEFVELFLSRFKRADFRHLTPQESSEIATSIIRMCLEHGAAENIKYQEPRKGAGRDRVAPPARQARSVGWNDRCPCGSGRKYKNCCGGR